MLLKNGLACDYHSSEVIDLRLENGRITERGTLDPKDSEEVLECSGKLVLPALIDLGIYPKNKTLSLQNLKTLNQKCLHGGVGSALLAADTSPCFNQSLQIEWLSLANKEFGLNLYASILGLNEGKITDIASLHALGARALYLKSSELNGHHLMVFANYSKMLKMPIVLLPLDDELGRGVMNEGLLATQLGLPSIPEVAYSKDCALACEVSRALGVEMLLGVYDLASFELIDSARSRGACISAQTSIHHLALNEKLCEGYNTRAKIHPPLKNQKMQEELLNHLKEGRIFTLTSLQNATYNSLKDEVFELASSGVDEISRYFSLLYTFLVKNQVISLQELMRLCAWNPAQFLKLPKGALDVGLDADLIVVDLEHQEICEDGYSPYFGMPLWGRVQHRILSGKIKEL